VAQSCKSTAAKSSVAKLGANPTDDKIHTSVSSFMGDGQGSSRQPGISVKSSTAAAMYLFIKFFCPYHILLSK